MLPRDYEWLAAALKARHEAELRVERKRQRRRAFLRKWLTLPALIATLGLTSVVLMGGYFVFRGGWHQDPLRWLNQQPDSSKELMEPARVRQFADVLLSAGITDAQGHARLLEDVDRGRLASTFDLLRYCKYARGFELSRYPWDPSVFLPRIHADVAEIMPELRFTDFRYVIELDPEFAPSEFSQHRLRVSFVVNGTRYSQTSFIDPETRKDFGRIDDQEFYQVFNKVLSDHGSEYRLHSVHYTTPFGPARAADYSRFGIIALTKQQADVLHHLPVVGRDFLSYLHISNENFERRPSPDEVRAAITTYRSAGILGDISDANVARYTEEALASSYQSYRDVISAFPGVTYRMWLKSDADKPYADELHRLSVLSRGRFKPEHIVDETGPTEDNQRVRVSFVIGKKTFSSTVTSYGRWVDPSILEIAIGAQKETDPVGRFYLLKDNENATLIYLTKKQYDIVREKKILEFEAKF